MTESPGDSLARDVRKYVFDHFLEYAVPPVLEQIMERYHLERPDAFAVLKALEEARHLKLVPGTQRILMAFPFSAVATPFRTTRPVIGRRYYAKSSGSKAVAIIARNRSRSSSRVGSRAHPLQGPWSISRFPHRNGGMILSLPARTTWCSSPLNRTWTSGGKRLRRPRGPSSRSKRRMR